MNNRCHVNEFNTKMIRIPENVGVYVSFYRSIHFSQQLKKSCMSFLALTSGTTVNWCSNYLPSVQHSQASKIMQPF